tara:strand:- start:385 stop:786 length:402 start_codon:yes stop_codon:yes gene_type:complete
MSTITVTNIKATGETASRAVSGIVAADIRFACDTATINASNNVSTITDNGVGDFSINFANNFNDTAYGHTAGTSRGAFNTSVIINFEGRDDSAITASHTTSSFRGEAAYVNSSTNRTNLDIQRVSATFHGDLA